MKYCTKCLMPSTKPYITFDEEGVCVACRAHEKKKAAMDGINWDERREEFYNLVDEIKKKQAPFYDALVPVSGGKDSITQVHYLLNRGLRILAVNIDYGVKTDIGRDNLNCIAEMGAHLMIYRPELTLHRRLIRIGMEEYGDPDLLSHTMLHGYPQRVALQFNIPLVLLGENSAFEYGGDSSIASSNQMTRAWFDKYAANSGNNPRKISEKHNIPYDLLKLYDFPDEIETADVKNIFAGYYFYWDSEAHLEIAEKYGFKGLSEPREGTYRTYVGIDEKINRVHQYLKVLKFGYGRGTDHACEDIRCGRVTREEAKRLVKQYDLQPLGKDYIEDCAAFMGYSPDEFVEILERYRNRDLWKQEADGSWVLPGHLEE